MQNTGKKQTFTENRNCGTDGKTGKIKHGTALKHKIFKRYYRKQDQYGKNSGTPEAYRTEF